MNFFYHNNRASETPQIEYQKIDNLIPISFANFLESELMNMNSWLYVDSASGTDNHINKIDKNSEEKVISILNNRSFNFLKQLADSLKIKYKKEESSSVNKKAFRNSLQKLIFKEKILLRRFRSSAGRAFDF